MPNSVPECPPNVHNATAGAPLLSEVLTLSDAALLAFVDFIRLNSSEFTRNPAIIRRVFTAYVMSDTEREE